MFLIPPDFTHKVLPGFQEVEYFFPCICEGWRSLLLLAYTSLTAVFPLALCKQVLQDFSLPLCSIKYKFL